MDREGNLAEESYFIGELMFVIYQNEKEHFTIAKFKVNETNEELDEHEIVAKRYLATLQEATPYTFYCQVEHHPNYRHQYNVDYYQLYIPDSKSELVDYLSSDLFQLIGPKT